MKKTVSALMFVGIAGIIGLAMSGNMSSKTEGGRESVTPSPDEKGKRQILFFLNPNGRPCRMQSSILDAMSAELSSYAQVTYINTTVKSDLSKFRQYGIRGLPSLVILDEEGQEIGRFTGIQGKETILAAVGGDDG